jgi:hypothetical protein
LDELPDAMATRVLRIFSALLFLYGLDAYDIGPIPVEWIAQVATVAAVIYLAGADQLYRIEGMKPLVWLLVWSVAATLANSILYDYARLMPSHATTPYFVFIPLRLLTLFVLLSTIHLVNWLVRQGRKEEVVRATVLISSVLALTAIYVYVAQTHGLPELPRNRMATSGGEQAASFSYSFDRATGTFREPAILARWLLLPLLLCLVSGKRILSLSNTILSAAFLLTGSLTGAVSFIGGLLGGFLLTGPASARNVRALGEIVLLLGAGLGLFYLIAMGKGGSSADLIGTLRDRATPLVVGEGIEATNRAAVFDYVLEHRVPPFGEGFGNANIVLGEDLSVEVIPSFLSLYVCFAYSVGIVGLILLAWFLGRPLLRVWRLRHWLEPGSALAAISGYLAWLIAFAAASEEFTFMFGIAFVLVDAAIDEALVNRMESEAGEATAFAAG